ncbi:class I tRNA ligase family protein, partial [Streptomyces sp. TRM76130]|nr:class I tRNA ligase family protein [Streptomyces sp. TRM76130]
APDENRDWRSWWYGPDGADDVRYTEFMAKDNVPFHSVMFPATEMGVREPWKRVDHLKAFNWLTYYGGKFSTSQRRGVFTDQALDILPADYWRYFLMANAPESDDASFTWEHFTATVNKDLADTLGNFVNRVLSFSRKRFGDEVPAGAEPGEAEANLGTQIAGLLTEYENQMEALQFRKAAAALRALWSAGNSYLEEKAPWLEIKTDQAAAALTLRTAMNLIHLYAVVSEPFIPASAQAMRAAFALPDDTATWVTPAEARALARVPAG